MSVYWFHPIRYFGFISLCFIGTGTEESYVDICMVCSNIDLLTIRSVLVTS